MQNRRNLALFIWSLCCVLVHTATAQPSDPARPAPILAVLRERIAQHISQPRFAAAMWGVKIVSIDTGKVLFEHNADKLLKPASNAKLYTAALALERLGPDYRIKTSLYAATRPDPAGTLRGDLVVYGRGDPSFAARFNDGNYQKSLEPLVAALAASGVKRIEGDLVGDDSYFRGPPLGSGWTWDDLQYYYGAEASALTVEDNVIDLVLRPGADTDAAGRIETSPATTLLTFINRTRTVAKGGRREINLYRPIGENIVYVSGRLPADDPGYRDAVAVHDPAQLFLSLFKEALSRRGIAVSGRLRRMNWLERESVPIDFTKLLELGSVDSRPLGEILSKMLKASQNLYAQLLLLQVGAQRQSAAGNPKLRSADQTTEEAGLKELNAFLTEAGIKNGEALLEEGSGLSRGALVTPNATVSLLQFMNRHGHADVFRDSLPVGGVDGTLKTRMKGTPAEGNVRAKTGTMRYVNTLSGYLTTAAGERLAFSIMLNNYFNPNAAGSARTDVDAVAVMLAGFAGHTKLSAPQ